jgi:parallel beta-helix repeat protein
MSAIFCNSTSGSVRGNNISGGHITGIYFANASSMNVGGNIITGCLLHGMFVGDGSVLNITGKLVQDLGHHYYYAVSGYNKIYENGGYEGPGEDNDGSEIFFSGKKSNAIMDKG